MLKFLLLKQQQNAALAITGSSLYLDSSNVLSYPGSGTTWTDLSPSANNFTLVGSPTYDTGDAKSISFNGTTQYAGSGIPVPIGPGRKVTIEIVFKRTGAWASDNMLLSNNRSGYGHGFSLLYADSNAFSFFTVSTYGPPYGWGVSKTQSLSIDTWYHGMISIDIPYGNTVVMTGNIAINGSIQSFSQTITGDYPAQNYNIEVCRHVNYTYGTTYGKFKIGLVRIYDRQLTTAEMIQNYNSCRTRFGI